MQTIKVKNGADIDIYTDDGVGIIVVRPNPEQLPPPAPQDIQPEGQRVRGAEELPQEPPSWFKRVFFASDLEIAWINIRQLILDRQQPVAAGAPLGGAGEEKLRNRFFDLVKKFEGGTEYSQAWSLAALQLAREAVAAERERCAGLVEEVYNEPSYHSAWRNLLGNIRGDKQGRAAH